MREASVGAASVETGVDSHADCATPRDGEVEASFVYIMCGLDVKTEGESEQSTFAEVLLRASLIKATILEDVVDATKWPVC